MFKFLNLNPESFGLDINDSSLKIVKTRKKFGLLMPVSFGEKKLSPGIIENGVIKNEEALIKEIKELAAGTKGERLATKYITVSLPEEKSFFQVVQMPKMEKQELKSAIVFEAENYIPMPSEHMYLDFQVVDPIVDHLEHLDVLIVAMEKTMVDSYVSCIKKAGFFPVALESEAQSAVRALIKNETSLSPVVIIDLEGSRADFIVFAGHSIRFTSSMQAVDLEKLADEIKKYLDFYLTHDSHTHLHLPKNGGIEKIILSGAGDNFKGADEFLKKNLGIPVEFGNPLINFSAKLKKTGLDGLDSNPLAFATAIGLSLRKPEIEKK